MPPHRLIVTSDPDYTGTLTLGRHPEGTLDVEDGVGTVASQDLAERLADAYPNLAADGAVSAQSSADDSEADDLALDPTDHTVSALRDALSSDDYSEAELAAALDAERGSEARDTAIDALESALEG